MVTTERADSYRTVLHAAISVITKGRQPMVVAETLVQ